MLAKFLETPLERIAKIISRQYGIQVFFKGKSAYTDGKSIVLPAISPDENNENFAKDLEGYLDHEVAHCLFSNFKDLEKVIDNKLAKEMTNAIEDLRIEKEMMKEYPGTFGNIIPLRDKWTKIVEENWDNLIPAHRIINNVIKIMEDQPLRLDDEIRFLFTKEVIKLAESLKNAKTTKSIIKIVLELVKMFDALTKEQKKKAEKKQKNEKGNKNKNKNEDSEDGEDGDSEDGEDGDSEDGEDGDSEDSEDGEDGDSEDGNGENVDSEGDSEDGDSEDKNKKGKKGKNKNENEEENEEENEDESNGDDSDSETDNEEKSKTEKTKKSSKKDQRSKKQIENDGLDEFPDFEEAMEDYNNDEEEQQVHDLDSYMQQEIDENIEQETEKKFSERRHIPFTTENDKFIDLRQKTISNHLQNWWGNANERAKTIATPLLLELERLLKVKENEKWLVERERGKIHTSKLASLASDPNYRTPFKEKFAIDTKNVAVQFIVDMSGSMSGIQIEVAVVAILAMSMALQKLDIPFEILGFNSINNHDLKDNSHNYDYDFYNRICVQLQHYLFKDFHDRKLDSLVHALGETYNTCNCDGESIKAFAKRIVDRKEKRKIMFVFSDGEPHIGEGEVAILATDLKRSVQQIKQEGIEIIGIGIMTNAVKQFYDEYIIVNKLSDLASESLKELKKVLLK